MIKNNENINLLCQSTRKVIPWSDINFILPSLLLTRRYHKQRMSGNNAYPHACWDITIHVEISPYLQEEHGQQVQKSCAQAPVYNDEKIQM